MGNGGQRWATDDCLVGWGGGEGVVKRLIANIFKQSTGLCWC
ncbi:MAG: hypothetical protein AAF316_13380 [Cyanobacteria bacterium P01_A01_bin.80]